MAEVSVAWGLLLLTGFYPLYRAWRGAAGGTLQHPLFWAAIAWALWCVAVCQDGAAGWTYLALSVTACAGVAVLGARRPGVAAWHFVVLGLLAALLRPFLEGFGALRLETAHVGFLAVALSVGVGNYLPTRQAPAAALLGLWCGLELGRLSGVVPPIVPVPLILVPWAAWLVDRGGGDDFLARWRSFRDRFGFLWAQRVREQFNRAAENAGLPVVLGWSGARADPGADTARADELLRSVLRRFLEGSHPRP